MVCRLRQVRCTSASERYSVNFLHRRRQPTTLPCSLPNSYLNDQSQVEHISTQTNLKDALDKKYYSQRPVEKENTSPLRKQEVPRSASTCERNRSSTFKKKYTQVGIRYLLAGRRPWDRMKVWRNYSSELSTLIRVRKLFISMIPCSRKLMPGAQFTASRGNDLQCSQRQRQDKESSHGKGPAADGGGITVWSGYFSFP